jgi:hypothetical protein
VTNLAVQTTSNTSVTPAALTIVATAPSGIVDGDILLACVAKNTVTAPTTVPAGWALVSAFGAYRSSFPAAFQAAGNVGTGWAGMYWKKAASESGNYTWGSTSAIWNVQILRISTYKGPKPGGAYVDDDIFNAAKINARATNTISQGLMTLADLAWEAYLMVHQFVQTVATTAPVFSALSASMTPVANVSQSAAAALTQEVAWEYIDRTANPNFGSRQVTTDTASGSTGGYCVLLSDPAAITGIAIDKRNDLRPASQ